MQSWMIKIVIAAAFFVAGHGAAVAANSPSSDLQQFAAKVEQTLNDGDASFLDRHLDYDAIIDKAVSGIEAKKDLKDGFAKGAKGKAKEVSIGKQVLDSMGESGSYRFLRLMRQGNEDRALFRLLQDGGGVNYHGFVLTRDKKGSIIISDFYNFMSGELLSETLRRTFIMAVAGVQQGNVVSLFTKEGDFIRNISKIKEMQKLGAERKFREALKVYDALPASVQRDKGVLLLKIIYSADIDEKEYEKGMDLYKKSFPTDPSLDLVTLDSLVLKKKYADALKNIERLDRNVGGDPYLSILRANMYMLDGKNAQAKQWASKAIKEEKTLTDGYWTLVTIALAEKNHKETARLLNIVENDLGIGLSDLKGVTEYADFVKSAEYQKWMKGREQ